MIVSAITKSILPDIRWDDSHVQGKSNILKIIGEKIEKIGVSRKYNIKVVGLYGVGGIGKTTMCKTLCNELLDKYEGRVCHIELPNAPWSNSKEFYRKVLRDLTRKSVEVIQHLNEGECKDNLRKNLSKQRTFLAIDNVLDNHKSIQLAKMLLELPYHLDSLVVVTACSQSVLELLKINRDAYLEMPDLEEADAMKLFLHHAIGGKKSFRDEEKYDILTCVRRCYFSKGDGRGHHYHPLALQVLGLQLNYYGENPSIWVKNMPRVMAFNFLSGGNPVYDILRSSFDLLSSRDQTFFLDVGYFSYMAPFSRSLYSEWVFDMYKEDEEEILQQVERLKRKGLLVDVDLRSKRISMHDLYREFSLLEVKGFLKELELGERKWLSVDKGNIIELVKERGGGYWHKLIRLSIKYHCVPPLRSIGGIEGFGDIKWDYFLNLEVLQLCNLDWRIGALNFEGLGNLRILEVSGHIDGIEGLEKLKHLTCFTWITWVESPYRNNMLPMNISSPSIVAHIVGQLPSSLKQLKIFGDVEIGSGHIDGIEGLEKLKHLTCFTWITWVESPYRNNILPMNISSPSIVAHIVGQLPSSLKQLKIFGDVEIGSDLLTRCYHISNLELRWVVTHSLDLSTCWSLERLSLWGIQKMQTLSGLVISRPSNLKSLDVSFCLDLVDISKLDHLTGLKELFIMNCPKFEVPSLNGFNQLEVLTLRGINGLTSLAKLGDLPALRRLDLENCKHLMQLPDLSKSRNLQKLNLQGCSALKLHEREIQMLSALPLLEPLQFHDKDDILQFKLDLHRGKLLHQNTIKWSIMDDEWEERDLGQPPIEIRKFLDPLLLGKEYVFHKQVPEGVVCLIINSNQMRIGYLGADHNSVSNLIGIQELYWNND